MPLDIHAELQQIEAELEWKSEKLKLTEEKLRNALAENLLLRRQLENSSSK